MDVIVYVSIKHAILSSVSQYKLVMRNTKQFTYNGAISFASNMTTNTPYYISIQIQTWYGVFVFTHLLSITCFI